MYSFVPLWKLANLLYGEGDIEMCIRDSNKTVAKIDEAAEALKQIAKSGKKVLFVGAKARKTRKGVIQSSSEESKSSLLSQGKTFGKMLEVPEVSRYVRCV